MRFSQMPYERPNIEELQAKAEEVIRSVKEAKNAQQQLDAYRAFSDLRKKVSDMSTLAHIRNTINTEDPFYEQERVFLDENMPLIEELQYRFYKAFVSSLFRAELEKSLGSLLFHNAELELKAFDPVIIPELQEENKLVSQYRKLLSSAQLEFQGQVLNLSQLIPYMESPSRDIRKGAFKKRTEFFMAHENELDEIYDRLVKVRDQMAKKLGFRNFVELGYIRMGRNCYRPEEVERFRDQVKRHLVPITIKLREEQRERLGLERLTYIDIPLYFKEGNPRPEGTPEEIFEAGRKMYDMLSPETSEFFRFMLDNELMDVLSRKAKAPGGYMTYIFTYESPFIFANFNGTSGDVDVSTHECGHALNGYLSRDIEILEYKLPTLDACEVHSMSMEFFTMPWMKFFFGDRTGEYKYMHLASALLFIPYGCLVDEFQHVVYENPGMTPKERKEAWQKLEREYQPYLDYEDDPFFGRGGTWQRQSHIYNSPFYYIDYCLAQTCALQFRSLMARDYKDAWDKYISFSKKAGTMTFVDLLKSTGLKSPFDDGFVKEIASDCLKALNEMKP
ncbi:MAG: M3 family oligoendopeptidase [Clostridiaceae bacterium]|nr:M3 family oligoendopeptidase [Clostridiaceae bacterium]